MKKQIIIKSFLAASLLFTLSSFTSKKASKAPKQEITINIETDPGTLDGRKARLLRDFNLIRNFNEGLFRKNKQGKIVPAIAKSYTVSEDKKTYEIELKKTYWSNGDRVTSHDFIYAWQSLLNKEFPSPNASFLFYIKNAEKIKQGKLRQKELGAYASGDYKIIVELNKPIPFFTELLSLPIYFAVNRYIDKQDPSWVHSAKTYVCNGPFRPISWRLKDSIECIKNDKYWDKKSVKLDKITMLMLNEHTAYNLFQQGAIDHIGCPCSKIPTEVQPIHRKNNTILTDASLIIFWIRTNIDYGPLKNADFRKSLALAVDRKMIADHIFPDNFTPATTIIPEAMGLKKTSYFKDGDINQARKYLEKAIKSSPSIKNELKNLTLSYINTPNNQKVAATIQDHWRKNLGIEILLEPLEIKVFADRVAKREFQLAYSGRIADYNDPINFLELFKNKDLGTNNTGWEDKDYIEAVNQSYNENNSVERAKYLLKAESIITDQMPVIPMHYEVMLHLKSDKLKDLILTETGILDLKWTYVDVQ